MENLMSKRTLAAALGLSFLALGLFAAPFTYDAASHSIVTKAAFAKNGADDGKGHDAGDDHGGKRGK